jgi:hypothetical protein
MTFKQWCLHTAQTGCEKAAVSTAGVLLSPQSSSYLLIKQRAKSLPRVFLREYVRVRLQARLHRETKKQKCAKKRP